MDTETARRLLGVPPGADVSVVRTAYRRLVRSTHPDLTSDAHAAERTIELRLAYELLLEVAVDPGSAPAAAPPTPPPYRAPTTPPAGPPVVVERLDADTVGVGLPPDETLHVVLEVAHRLGDVAYLDPSTGLVEVVVEFLDAPTSSVLVHLQGRATGQTEVVCSIEPLSGGAVPPTEAVTTLLHRTIREVLDDPTR